MVTTSSLSSLRMRQAVRSNKTAALASTMATLLAISLTSSVFENELRMILFKATVGIQGKMILINSGHSALIACTRKAGKIRIAKTAPNANSILCWSFKTVPSSSPRAANEELEYHRFSTA